jgi:anti-sigma factor RsiW
VKATILPLASDEHQAVQELLPWYVNGTLGSAEDARVQAHLAHCPRCQGDAAWQARLRQAPTAGPAEPGAVDRDWAALRRRLQSQGGHAPGHRSPTPRWLPTNGLRLATGALAVTGLALALAWLRPAPHDETYHALGAAPNSMAANALVVFRPDATEAQIRLALRANGARLVGGPTVTDAYLLQLPPGALARLRTDAAVARVESLEAEAPR